LTDFRRSVRGTVVVVCYALGLLLFLANFVASGCRYSPPADIPQCEDGPFATFVNVLGIVDLAVIGTLLVASCWKPIRRIVNLFTK
jgi:hypothetical protein